jgi:hypothetical protein
MRSADAPSFASIYSDARSVANGTHMTTLSKANGSTTSALVEIILFCALGLFLSLGVTMTSYVTGSTTYVHE